MSPPQQLRQRTSNCSSLLIYRPQKDERLSWPSWLTYSGWFTHISGHPSATGRAQDSKSTLAKDRCSTAGPRNQPLDNKARRSTLLLSPLAFNDRFFRSKQVSWFACWVLLVNLFQTRTSWDQWNGDFYGTHVLCANQPSVLRHRRKHKALTPTSGLTSSLSSYTTGLLTQETLLPAL